MNCSRCGRSNDLDAEFCENCGSPLALVCENCGAALKPTSRFCKRCGAPVAGAAPAIFPAGNGETAPASGRLMALRQATPSGLKQKLLAVSAQSEGERKPVTILFADIVDSMALAAQLDPEVWRAIVNDVHQRISSAVYRYEGIVAQLLGDGVLAFFGAPITHEDDPVRAVRSALDIRAEIGDYAQIGAGRSMMETSLQTMGTSLQTVSAPIRLRIGLSTGTVVVGAVGSDLHLEYLAIGDAVNLASRLQSAAQPGQILIAETTARLVRPVFDLQPMPDLAVKGLAAPVRAFAVAGPKMASDRERDVEGLSSPLVGRESELASLRQALSMLSDGHGQVAFVLGEAGIGKSRLVEESKRQETASGAHPSRWLEGRALSYGQTLSFWMISQLIKRDLGVSDADSETVIREALHQRLQALFGQRAQGMLPYLLHLLGLKGDGYIAKGAGAGAGFGDQTPVSVSGGIAELDGETLKRQALLALSSYFAAVANEQPTVLVCEDAHWADASTLEALDQLLGLTNRAPLMVLVLARAERDHGIWQLKIKAETDFAHRLTDLHLKPLSALEGSQLVDNLLEVAELGENVRRLVLDHAEGNPFYMEELIRSLIEQGVLVRENHHWRAARPISDVEIPSTIEGVLLARIDRLPDRTRRTLQIASVVGRSFLYRLLAAIAEANGDLDGHLAALQSADLVREQARRPELEYSFKHALTQEAAYNSLLIERRREFHRRVGLALEDLFNGRREEYLGLLARHFDLAGEREKAVAYLLQAGDKARLSDAHVEAVKFYERAIHLLEDSGETSESNNRLAAATWLKLGMVYHTNFEFDLAHQANEAAFALQQKARAGGGRGAGGGRVRPLSGSNAEGEALDTKLAHRSQTPIVLRGGVGEFGVLTLDPGQVALGSEAQLAFQLFAGLAEFDSELNLTPHAARSWQVLDGGLRYLIYLRDDVRWSDGTRLTAADFEWAWKRNLKTCQGEYPAKALDDIVGARDYREGRHDDPDRVGVCALDDTTLEVRLVSPVAYFPYLFALPITFPLPRAVVERFGDDWWKAEHFVGNGPFVLREFDPTRLAAAERNSVYFGDFGGNVDRIEWLLIKESEMRQQRFLAGELDFTELRSVHITPDLVPRIIPAPNPLHCSFITLSPHPPLDDVRVRRALVHALDRDALSRLRSTRPAWGGLIPSGMPGHSPELGLPYAPELAQRLLAEAGYPGGRGFPTLCGVSFFPSLVEEAPRLWREVLGVEANIEQGKLKNWRRHDCLIYMHGWIADYPDPDSFMRQASFYEFLRDRGWHDERYSELVEAAARSSDRARRLALYRQADRILVADQTLVAPLDYGAKSAGTVAQPWVKDVGHNVLRFSPLGYMRHRYTVVESHTLERVSPTVGENHEHTAALLPGSDA